MLSWQERLEIRARSHSESRGASSRDISPSRVVLGTIVDGATSGRQTRTIVRREHEVEVDKQLGGASVGLPPSSGRLPGLYQNYLLIRPWPTFRIVFVSPALRIPGLLQSPLLDRIGGADRVRTRLVEALQDGLPITAKVTWLPRPRSGSSGSDGGSLRSGRRREGSIRGGGGGDDGEDGERECGKTRWLCCTPLFGSDDRVGVWVVVMVEDESVVAEEGGEGEGVGRGRQEDDGFEHFGTGESWMERAGEVGLNESIDAGLEELAKDVMADRHALSKEGAEEEWLGVKGEEPEPEPVRRKSESRADEEKVKGSLDATKARRRETRVLEGRRGFGSAAKAAAVGEGIWVKEKGSQRVGSGMGRLILRTERSLDGGGEKVWREEFVA